MRIWINGQPTAAISVTDRGLAFGDGLFETMRVVNGKIPLREKHLARLARGCVRLNIPLDLPVLCYELDSFVEPVDSGVCKLIYTRGSGLRGYATPSPTNPERVLQISALPEWPEELFTQGINLYPCQTRLACQPLLAGIKHLNRLEQVMARAEWQGSTFAEGLVKNQQDEVVEGVFSNVFYVKNAQLYTPDLSKSGVLGTMREHILQLATRFGLSAEIKVVTEQDLMQADEVFMCNGLYGIWPVSTYKHQQWLVGPITHMLQRHVALLFSGNHAC